MTVASYLQGSTDGIARARAQSASIEIDLSASEVEKARAWRD